jgi:hypothetical protein
LESLPTILMYLMESSDGIQDDIPRIVSIFEVNSSRRKGLTLLGDSYRDIEFEHCM